MLNLLRPLVFLSATHPFCLLQDWSWPFCFSYGFRTFQPFVQRNRFYFTGAKTPSMFFWMFSWLFLHACQSGLSGISGGPHFRYLHSVTQGLHGDIGFPRFCQSTPSPVPCCCCSWSRTHWRCKSAIHTHKPCESGFSTSMICRIRNPSSSSFGLWSMQCWRKPSIYPSPKHFLWGQIPRFEPAIASGPYPCSLISQSFQQYSPCINVILNQCALVHSCVLCGLAVSVFNRVCLKVGLR